MWNLLAAVFLLAAEAEKYGHFKGNFVKKEPQRSNKLRRMVNRRIRKCEFASKILVLERF